MKAGGGKIKGNSFQWKIAKLLSLWYSEQKRDDIFIPTGSSGARATQRRKLGKTTQNQGGDITSVDPEGFAFIKNFSIECKFYKKVNFNSLIYNKPNELFYWWDQTNRDADRDNKNPLLIMKQNGLSEIIIFSKNLYIKKLENYCGNIDNFLNTKSYINGDLVIIMLLSDFFNYCNPNINYEAN